ncbi:phospholipase D family protein [Pseudotabrizicola formosa]|uniref:phospholipase D family protein n=1 Tax=Pseudotabrizicola formosa TaxID=2030009 RepID=UPI000CD212F9|nr:phospholipase D family protein [Pseudotabrizicola formosa]
MTGAAAYLLVGLAFAIVCVVLARRTFRTPPLSGRVNSTALPPIGTGAIARAIGHSAEAPGRLTGVRPLSTGTEAFAARITLADAAVSSIDAQYYIWYADLTGYMLLDALRRAADRGVRVRLLLDDLGTAGIDPELAELEAHPNVEVRLYNPFPLRRAKALCYAFDFFRLNRRMHNKSFTVDGVVTILGGRNVGDRYFDTGDDALFVDLDVLATGAIVPAVSEDFDRYWACLSAHPAGPIIGTATGGSPIAHGLARFRDSPHFGDHLAGLNSAQLCAEINNGRLELEWTHAVLVSDDPVKGLGAVPLEDLLATRLMQAVGRIERRIDLVSPYLVPGKAGLDAFTTLTSRGVAVRALTNSLEATDVVAVHAGYVKRRRAMLRAGLGLFELHAGAAPDRPGRKRRRMGLSKASLHAKTFAVDDARLFVGSFNFDPRSTTLNTEMGILIESPRLAGALHAVFDMGLSGAAWQVGLRHGQVIWTDTARQIVVTDEPGSTALKRLAVRVVGWLPVEWLM